MQYFVNAHVHIGKTQGKKVPNALKESESLADLTLARIFEAFLCTYMTGLDGASCAKTKQK